MNDSGELTSRVANGRVSNLGSIKNELVLLGLEDLSHL